MTTKKTPSTVTTMHPAKEVATKTSVAKLIGGGRKPAAKKTASKSSGVAKRVSVKKKTLKSASSDRSRRASSDKTALDVLRLFIETYENL